ncbi:MAG: choice-of-anchor J domain-containing protein [Williamsia sp.]|nr:choice-of-anchor J domain-containing protein [Williamsia sp.]
MQRLEERLERDPALRARFEAQRTQFNRTVQERSAAIGNANKVAAVYTIPVVFHVVLTNPAVVTDAQLQAQIDTLNKDYAGLNGDSTRIPSYFKSLFGKSSIQFCLAQRTPDGESTNGIERITTTRTSFSNTDDGVKHASSGGADSWNSSNYFNVWVCVLSNNILGYATFPQDGNETEQGVVVDYRSLPGSSFAAYNGGKTLTHESGHYFNLIHIWGDDETSNNTCSGTDYIDDTPNQSVATTSCYTGVRTDNCTSSGNGIMYQNYMDYSNDACLVMFTNQQVVRMESALLTYRSSLLASNACQPVVLRNFDAQVLALSQPAQRLCGATFSPAITIRNRGAQTLTAVTITVRIDSAIVSTTNWTGSLARSATAAVTLNSLTTPIGNHLITVALSQPNGSADEDPTNNVIAASFQYYTPVAAVTESFENTAFPPQGWDVVNPDNGITWQRVTGSGKTGTGSVRIDNLNNTSIGQKDDLRMPTLSIASTVDTAYLSFQVAAAAYTNLTATNNNWDTLEVLVSTDCGASYASVYKKWGSSLVTRTAATTTSFVPAATEWRKDSINLSAYIGAPSLLVAFRNTSGNENNVYLDDVNFRTITVNPFLKEKGFLATPNPTSGLIAVQFYPQPVNLQGIEIYSTTGQKLAETLTYGQTRNYYSFDLSGYASGTYIVRAVFSDRVIVRKIVKL